ncbi:MAG: hypothetical protein ACRD3W_25890, partial [Terriglobales bacterium]
GARVPSTDDDYLEMFGKLHVFQGNSVAAPAVLIIRQTASPEKRSSSVVSRGSSVSGGRSV